MRKNLNAGAGDLIGQELLREIAERGFVGVRQDIKKIERVEQLVNEFVSLPLKPNFVIQCASVTAEMAQKTTTAAYDALGREGYSIEIGNELNIPDNEIRPGPFDPRVYAGAFAEIETACRRIDPEVEIMTGGVFGLSRSALDWVAAAVAQASPRAIVAFHPYREKNSQPQSQAWPGFSSRSDEIAQLRKAAGGREIRATELGWTTAPQTVRWLWIKRTVQLTDEQVLSNLQAELRFLQSQGIAEVTVYQVNDGPDPNNGLHRFGMRDVADNWKPQAAIGRFDA